MAKYRAPPGREDGSHPASVSRDDPMPDRVHTAVERMQPAGLESMTDRTAADPEVGELGPGDHAVLKLRERSDGAIDFVRLQFGPYDGLKCGGVFHRPRMAPKP
jgi:hypothetical protein